MSDVRGGRYARGIGAPPSVFLAGIAAGVTAYATTGPPGTTAAVAVVVLLALWAARREKRA
ncbi:MAG: hypothetical protein ACREH9_01035 [Pseudomonadota bacterium]